MKWAEISKTLGIVAETRIVYRAPKGSRWKNHKARLTKEAALQDALRDVARSLDYCDCDDGDEVAPPHYCGCSVRIPVMIETLREALDELPESAARWQQIRTAEYWADYWDRNDWRQLEQGEDGADA